MIEQDPEILMTCLRCQSQIGRDRPEPDLEHKPPGSQLCAHFYHTLPKSPQLRPLTALTLATHYTYILTGPS